MSTYGHHLNKLGRPWDPYAIYQYSALKLSWFWRRYKLGVTALSFQYGIECIALWYCKTWAYNTKMHLNSRTTRMQVQWSFSDHQYHIHSRFQRSDEAKGNAWTLCMLGNFACFFVCGLFFLKLTFSKKAFRNTLSVKQFGSRSGRMFCRAPSYKPLLDHQLPAAYY